MDIALGCPCPAACLATDYAFHTRELMAEAYAIVRNHAVRCVEVMKSNYDAAVKPAEFYADDLVWYFCPRSHRVLVLSGLGSTQGHIGWFGG